MNYQASSPSSEPQITVVLICSGNGSDTQSYQPNRDHQQWWNRRDALVRCVSASLFSQNYTATAKTSEVEKGKTFTIPEPTRSNGRGWCDAGDVKLLLLYDEDGSVMEMRRLYHHDRNHDNHSRTSTEAAPFVPTEQKIISMWRRASSQYNKGGIDDEILLPWKNNTPSNNGEIVGSQLKRKRGLKNNNFTSNGGHHNDSSQSLLIGGINIKKKGEASNSSSVPPLDVKLSLPCKDVFKHPKGAGQSGKEEATNSSAKMSTKRQPKMSDIRFVKSKRDLLVYIQNQCPFEYMKQCRLNASIDVILKKWNRSKLERVWSDWCNQQAQCCEKQTPSLHSSGRWNKGKGILVDNKGGNGFNAEGNSSRDKSISKELFHSILSNVINSNRSNDSSSNQSSNKRRRRDDERSIGEEGNAAPRVLVGLLHETQSSELPVSSWKPGEIRKIVGLNSFNTKVILFMGAVRDMTQLENKNLASVCKMLDIPIVGCRLGPVPEFTSKILQILTFHAANDRLIPSLLHLNQKQNNQVQVENSTKLKSKVSVTKNDRGSYDRISGRKKQVLHKNRLHVVVTLPILSSGLTSDLSERSTILWNIVRITVCTLWRSKVASSQMNYNLENILTFVFSDGLKVTISQETLVDVLAQKHQAAPSEYQILAALCELRDEVKSRSLNNIKKSSKQTAKDWDNLFHKLWISEQHLLQSQQTVEDVSLSGPQSHLCAIDITQEDLKTSICTRTSSDTSLIEMFYSGKPCRKKSCSQFSPCYGTIFAILNFEGNPKTEDQALAYKSHIINTLAKAGIPLLSEQIIPCKPIDYASTSITILQHLVYQEKLFCLIAAKLQ